MYILIYLLTSCIKEENIEKLKKLLKKDINLNCILEKGYSLLHIALERENKEIIELLIDEGS